MKIHKTAHPSPSAIIADFLAQDEKVEPFCWGFSSKQNFEKKINERARFASPRDVLVQSLQNQYKDFDQAETLQNIGKLNSENTFTVTTGHQLNFMGGPLYTFIKIAHTIALSRKLKTDFPEKDFVPVFWLASEDHDWAEINHFWWDGKKHTYPAETKGAVGFLKSGDENEIWKGLGGDFSEEAREVFFAAYCEGKSWAEAMRHIAHHWFPKSGLVVLDANDAILKREAAKLFEQELLTQISQIKVGECVAKMPDDYHAQVTPRGINLFYLENNSRERIVAAEDGFFLNDSGKRFSREEMLDELENHPERFSPNVILRPVYQEIILPNLAYIGGGGELAYWLQLKGVFEGFEASFPILVHRHSATLLPQSVVHKREKLGLEPNEIFEEKYKTLRQCLQRVSSFDLSLKEFRESAKNMFVGLEEVAQKTDPTMMAALEAEKARIERSFKRMEKKLYRAEKRRQTETTRMVEDLHNWVYPGGTLQERVQNYFFLKQRLGDFSEVLLKQFYDSAYTSHMFVVELDA